jgi:hypothetical protein
MSPQNFCGRWKNEADDQEKRLEAACNEAVSVFEKHFPQKDSDLKLP